MTAALRRGWCPGALRPMEAKDGLIVRIKPRGGMLTAEMAHALADLAERYGNGRLELTSGANLQMRGVAQSALPRLQDGLGALGLVDASPEAEAVRNVVASPLAGCHGGLDIRPLIAALEMRLIEDRALHALPGKFGFLIDDGSRPSLAEVAADIRFDWIGTRFSIGLGGTRREALQIGECEPSEVANRAGRVARIVVSLRAQAPEASRLHDLIETIGVDRVRDALGAGPALAPPDVAPCDIRGIVGLHTISADGLGEAAPLPLVGRGKGWGLVPRFAAGHEEHAGPPPPAPPHKGEGGLRPDFELPCLGLAAPFGRLDAAMLRAAAEAANGELRLTPWRIILLPGAGRAHVPGFITDPHDPRLAVAACVGAAGCARGTTDTPADADRLAATLGPQAGITLHVSGCEKGCAKPSATPLTLVARGGRYDLVRDGRAGDAPQLRGLDLAAARRALDAA